MYADPHAVNADLHCHSNRSDGTLEPSELARLAAERGVRIWSMTDHDEVSGQAEAARSAWELGLHYVTGVEISVTWAGETIHILGYDIDPDNVALTEGLAGTRLGRVQRAHDMAGQLERAGIEGALEGALRYASNPELVSRTHFARFLIERGICEDMREVFGRFLVAGKPGYVPMQWARLSDALSWIRGAGGMPVVAHPGRYDLDETRQWAFLQEFKEGGGAGIEIMTSSHNVQDSRKFARLAQELDLLASRGSDFHGPGESRVDMGALPPLPDTLVPIWHQWQQG